MVRRGAASRITQLLALAASAVVCTNIDNGGLQTAAAFESQVNADAKTGQSRDTFSLKANVRDPGWFSLKMDGSVLDLNPMRGDALTWYGFKIPDPALIEKTTVSDTRITFGILDDRVRWTSRQAVSNYIKPGTDPGRFNQSGLRFDNGATAQRLETSIFKADKTQVSLFAEYARVGTSFAAPDAVIKRQDPFFKANSTSRRLGATVERGPIAVTFEQRAQQSLASENAATLVQHQVGMSVRFDELFGAAGSKRDGVLWLLPSSAWLNAGQGKVRASLSQGVAGDSTSDYGFGLAWNRGNIYANIGYWHSVYQSPFYPWRGSGINGSLGFHEGLWGIDLYFDLSSSVQTYGFEATQPPTNQITSGLLFRTRF